MFLTEELNTNPAGQTVTENETAATPEAPAVEAKPVEKVEEKVAVETAEAPRSQPKSEPSGEAAPYQRREGGYGDRRGYYDRDGGQSFDQMMKAFRKQSVDIQRKLKKSRFYEKPSVKKRKQRQEAIKKARKNRRYH